MPTQPKYIPDHAVRVVLSVNPKAGAKSSRDFVDEVMANLRERGMRPEACTDLAEVSQRANELHAAGELRALVAVGGDGTAAELVNRTEPGVPLALMPTGNENLLARYIRVGKSATVVCKAIGQGRLVQFDAARANQRIFLVMLGCGFDGAVVQRVHGRRTGHIRSLDYFKPIWEVVRSYAYPEIRLGSECAPEVIGAGSTGCCRWLFAFNFPCYGGSLPLAPGASGRDGLLDICTFAGGSLWRGLGYAAAVYARVHRRLGICGVRQLARFRLTAETEVHYQLDGDPGGTLPVDVEVLPARLTLLVPESRADQLEFQTGPKA
ncbi:MAG: diacylglycerol/lipid kinase family protein [Planctomycetota bacterium]